MKTWDKVTPNTIDKFTKGCGVDLLSPGRHLKYLRRYNLKYLRNASPSLSTALMRLIQSA